MTNLHPLPWIAFGAVATLTLQWLMQMERRRLRRLVCQAYHKLLSRRRGSNPPPPGVRPPAPKSPFQSGLILPTLPARPRPAGGRLIRGDRDPGKP